MSNTKKYKHLWMVQDTGNRSFWTKVGVAFQNKDGSWSCELSAVPVNGKFQMRDPQPPREDNDSKNNS